MKSDIFSLFPLLPGQVVDDAQFSLQTQGFVVIENFYTLDICKYLKQNLEVAINEYKPCPDSERSTLDRYHMHDLLCRNIVFAKMLEDRRLNQLITSCLCPNWIMYAHTSSSLPPNGDNYGSRVHVDSPRYIPNYPTNLGVIWALDDFTKENGATYVLPGSHNTEKIPSTEFFEKNSTRLTCEAGAVIIFNARLWHRAGYNKTSIFRHALTMNVCRPFMKQRMDWVRFVPDSISTQLNDLGRRILGFDTRLPSSLQEFFLPEDQRLYKPNQE